MKKTTLFSLMLVCVIILTGIIGSAVLAQDDEPIDPVEGAVLIVVPDLFMMEVGASQETYTGSRTVLDVGETLRTDANGVALITWFYDGTESLLGPGSKLTLNALSGDQTTAFALDMSLDAGHMVGGTGYRVQDNPDGRWTITTPKFTFRPIWGQFEVTVSEDGTTRLVVTEGLVEIQTSGDPQAVEENSVVVNGGDPQTLSEDGIVVNLDGVCTATATTNLNVRLGPNEATRRLEGVSAGQQFWVRTGTDGNVWVQVYFQTDPLDEEGHNYGWVFGPALTFDEATCGSVLRAELAAVLFGGLGIDKDPLTNPDADLTREEVYLTVTAYYDGRFN